MPDAVDRSVEVSVEIAARPGTVWRCVTEGDLLSRWLAARVELEPVVGKPVKIHFERWKTRVEGTVVEVVPGRRLAFTWGVAEGKQRASMPPGSTRVSISLAPSKTGTRVVLVHSGFPTDEERGHHEGGWQGYAAALAGTATCVPAMGAPEALADAWLEAWAETDAARRNALLAITTAPGVTFRDTYADLTGRPAIAAWIATCQARAPGVRMVRDGAVLTSRGALLSRWKAVLPDGTAVGAGSNRFHLDADGLADAIEGYVGG